MIRATRLLVTFVVCLCLASGAASAQSPDPDRHIIKLNDMAKGKAAVRAAGGEVVKDLSAVGAVAVRIPAAALQGLANNPNIEYVELDAPRYLMAQSSPFGIAKVQADLVSQGAGGRTVCIIDSGYEIGHEDLANLGVTGHNGNLPPFEDGCGHGSHVAGTVAALDNNVGVVGVNPGVNLHIVRVFGNDCAWAFSSDLVAAALACRDAGADVISMSLGCSGRRCSSNTEENTFNQLWNEGMLSIAAAGNDGNTQMSFPASYDSVVSVAATDSANVIADFSQQNSQVELAAPGVTVRSTVPTGTGSDESATVGGVGFEVVALVDSPTGTGSGPLVDCGIGAAACPGGGGQVCLIERGDLTFAEKVQACEAGGGGGAIIYNNIPGLFSGTLGGTATSIPAVSMSQADGQSLDSSGATSATVTTGPGNYAFFDGTSMATPHVAGVAALVWSHDTSWTNQQIRDALAATAIDLGSAGRDNAYGFGLIQAQAALNFLQNPPSCNPTETSEVSCSDGVDNDCDGLVDNADPDCGGGSCTLLPTGASCTSGSQCCSGSCKGKPGSRTCK